MDLGANTVLITGGASGIGLALAERFLRAGSRVVVCGRREGKLSEVKGRHPEIVTRVCDVGDEAERVSLYEWATAEFPALNVLVNNAGIQRRVRLTELEEWGPTGGEIAINFEAPVHLSMLFLQHLKNRPDGAVVNVTSGVVYVPIGRTAVYSATKAALHSWTLSLRERQRNGGVRVFELIPTAVDTPLVAGVDTTKVSPESVARALLRGLETDRGEILVGRAAALRAMSRLAPGFIFGKLNPEGA